MRKLGQEYWSEGELEKDNWRRGERLTKKTKNAKIGAGAGVLEWRQLERRRKERRGDSPVLANTNPNTNTSTSTSTSTWRKSRGRVEEGISKRERKRKESWFIFAFWTNSAKHLSATSATSTADISKIAKFF